MPAQILNLRDDEKPRLQTHEESRLAAQHDAIRIDAANQLRLRLELENEISKQQLELAYQPIVTLANGRTAGFEALIRWPRPSQQAVFPDEIIPLTEQNGLIVPLGLWVLEHALQALSAIDRRPRARRDAGAGVLMSVSVSSCQSDSAKALLSNSRGPLSLPILTRAGPSWKSLNKLC